MNAMGRVLALDIGKKRIGLALSDPDRIISQPQGLLLRSRWEEEFQQLQSLIETSGVTEIVIGLPKRLDGSHGEMAEEAKAFAEHLKAQCHLPIHFWDERFSTHAAERTLLEGNVRRKRRKQLIDQTAAVWILQGYLDWRNTQ